MTHIQAPAFLFGQISEATVTNTIADTSSIGAGDGSRNMPAYFWMPKRSVRIKGGGRYTTPAVSNITTKVKTGGTTLLTKTTNGILNAQTNMPWTFEITITCLSVVGNIGTFVIGGQLLFDIGLAAPAVQFINTPVTKPTADISAAMILDITNAWDAANVNRSVTTEFCTIERLG